MDALVMKMNALCDALPFQTSWYLKDLRIGKTAGRPGTGSRGYMDSGIVFKGETSLFMLTAYREHVPAAVPGGTRGFTAANHLVGPISRLTWDALGG